MEYLLRTFGSKDGVRRFFWGSIYDHMYLHSFMPPWQLQEGMVPIYLQVLLKWRTSHQPTSCGGDVPRLYLAKYSGDVAQHDIYRAWRPDSAILWSGWPHQPAYNSWVEDVPIYYSATYSGDVAQHDISRVDLSGSMTVQRRTVGVVVFMDYFCNTWWKCSYYAIVCNRVPDNTFFRQYNSLYRLSMSWGWPSRPQLLRSSVATSVLKDQSQEHNYPWQRKMVIPKSKGVGLP